MEEGDINNKLAGTKSIPVATSYNPWVRLRYGSSVHLSRSVRDVHGAAADSPRRRVKPASSCPPSSYAGTSCQPTVSTLFYIVARQTDQPKRNT